MDGTPWTIRAVEFSNCNCSYGCPCQFNALPTHGHCRAVVGFKINSGHHGETKLDGLKVANSDEGNAAVEAGVREKVVALTGRFPMYPYM